MAAYSSERGAAITISVLYRMVTVVQMEADAAWTKNVGTDF